MKHTTRTRAVVVAGLLLMGMGLPRCSCEGDGGLRRADIEMLLTFVEQEPCSGAAIARRLPDDYQSGLVAATDLGSRGVRRFEVRSVGTAPLRIERVRLSADDPEYQVRLEDDTGVEVTRPVAIPPTGDPTRPARLAILVSYASQDEESDLVDLIVESDDPEREEVRFALAAGRGRLEVCGNTGCGTDAGIDLLGVSVDSEAEEMLTLSNVGEGNLDLRSVTLESSSYEFCAFEATEIPEGVEDCQPIPQCLILPPGGSYPVRVRYRPVDTGPDEATLVVASGDATAGSVEVPIRASGAGPALCLCVVDGEECSPASFVDFGQADVAAEVSRRVRITSCGTEAFELTVATLEADSANPFFTGPEFQIAEAFPLGMLDPGAASEGTVVYRPMSGGQHRGGLRIETGGALARAWTRLVGGAATCDLDVLPSMVSFQTVAGGSTARREVALVNAGARACAVQQISDPESPFQIVGKPVLPLVIPAGGSHLLTVEFAPPAGPVFGYTSSFELVSDEPGAPGPHTVQLAGQGGGTPQCEVEITPTGNDSPLTDRDGLLQFGAVNIGYDKTLPVRIQNVGNANCVVQTFRLETEAPTEFSVTTTDPIPFAIPPGGQLRFEVRFAPTMEAASLFGTYTGLSNHLDFRLQGPSIAQQDWEISIAAQPTQPTIDVLPDEVDFGLVTWDRPRAPDDRSSCGSAVRTVNVYNSGTGVLAISSVAIDPTSDPVFLVTGVRQNGNAVPAPYTNLQVPAGDSVQVELRFFPSRATPGEHAGLLVLDNNVTNPNGNGTPLTVPLAGTGTMNAQQTDTFQQLQENKIDILWVVDDSASMSEEQSLLAQNFQEFISFADGLGVDYHVAVTTTEVNDSVAGHIWACSGFNKILTSADPNRVPAFECAANVTTPPGGNRRPNPSGSDEQEAGLQAARIALDVPVVNQNNAGFLRADARLAVIVVTDEEDQSDGSVNLYIDFFRNLKGFANPQLVSLSAIAGDVPWGCATADAGRRYRDVAQALGGQFASVCASSWRSMLQNIGLGVFALRRAWTLSRPADASSLIVRVDGAQVPQNGTNGWTFDVAANVITFHGTQIPPPGATIDVQYGAVCIP